MYFLTVELLRPLDFIDVFTPVWCCDLYVVDAPMNYDMDAIGVRTLTHCITYTLCPEW